MWNNADKKEFSKYFVSTCKMYNQQVEADVVAMIIFDLEDLDFKTCVDALHSYRRDSRNKFWPKAADIRSLVNPELDPRELAIQTAKKIDQAVAKYGGYWEQGIFTSSGAILWEGGSKVHTSFKDAVIAELGDIGWHYVCSHGSWMNVRNSANEMDEGIFIAQTRDFLMSSIKMKQTGCNLLDYNLAGKLKEGSSSNSLLHAIKMIK